MAPSLPSGWVIARATLVFFLVLGLVILLPAGRGVLLQYSYAQPTFDEFPPEGGDPGGPTGGGTVPGAPSAESSESGSQSTDSGSAPSSTSGGTSFGDAVVSGISFAANNSLLGLAISSLAPGLAASLGITGPDGTLAGNIAFGLSALGTIAGGIVGGLLGLAITAIAAVVGFVTGLFGEKGVDKSESPVDTSDPEGPAGQPSPSEPSLSSDDSEAPSGGTAGNNPAGSGADDAPPSGGSVDAPAGDDTGTLGDF